MVTPTAAAAAAAALCSSPTSAGGSVATYHVAIIGGGIAGACAASVLASASAYASAAASVSSSSSSSSAAKLDASEAERPLDVTGRLVLPIASNLSNRSSGGGGNSIQRPAEIRVDLFDQGRRGVGGRSSRRIIVREEGSGGDGRGSEVMGWDHGCQFFRADTERFRPVVSNWISHGFVSEWTGRFAKGVDRNDDGSGGNGNGRSRSRTRDFFGMPFLPPFFVGADGMQSVPSRLLELCKARGTSRRFGGERMCDNDGDDDEDDDSILRVFNGTRVSRIERGDAGAKDKEEEEKAERRGGAISSKKWFLYGASGEVAYHDTPESVVKAAEAADAAAAATAIDGKDDATTEKTTKAIGRPSAIASGYDAVLFTDVSTTSFGGGGTAPKWHRASAGGIPERFVSRVRHRVNARVPLFSAMIAFDRKLDVPFDAVSFEDVGSGDRGGAGGGRGGENVIWFAARSNSKPGYAETLTRDCWTIVSTPEYALARIEETPMRDAKTGDFVPQSEEYLRSVPGPDLEGAFRQALARRGRRRRSGDSGKGSNVDKSDPEMSLPETVYLDAQRWGSAMPCHRHLDERSSTRKVIASTPYDIGGAPLAPTRNEWRGGRDGRTDDENYNGDGDKDTYLADEENMLFQAGDMVSRYTPGFEGAALSGMDAAECILRLLLSSGGGAPSSES